jgi:hypothetical protein
MQMNQKRFEMEDVRRKNFQKSVWIPLRAVDYIEDKGRYGYVGFVKELFFSGSIAVPLDKIDFAKKLGWTDIGISHNHSGYVEDGIYTSAEIYNDYDENFEGIHLVLDQDSDDEEPNIWHLNQDMVLALRLKREGNSWVCPREGYAEVARLKVSKDNKPVLIEIKSQYLKDYLCARNMALYMTHFFKREIVCEDASFIKWSDNHKKEIEEFGRWVGFISEIHEGGNPFGGKMAIFHVARTDVDESDDVPDLFDLPSDENTKSESREENFEGRKLFHISGKLWRNEIILPSINSPRVRDDKVVSNFQYFIDAEGNKSSSQELIDSGKWLWFKPEVMMALSHRRGGHLSFYTAHTGRVSCSYGYGTHFGVNKLGLVNAYAKDIGILPEWQQLIWFGNNIVPEGGVSKELLASQVRAEPATTKAPEEFLTKVIEMVNKLSQSKLGIKIFRSHDAIPELLKRTHRFRAVDEQSFYALAKDLARIIVDCLDTQAMQSIVAPPKKEEWGSLKSLENLLASKVIRKHVRSFLAPLVGVYKLRLADAHLPSSEIEDAYKLIEIDKSLPFVHQGYQMLDSAVASIFTIAKFLEKWPNGI